VVNGQPIKKHFLQNNDIIELGKYKLKYVNEPWGASQAADFEKTMVLRPGSVKAATWRRPPPRRPAPQCGPSGGCGCRRRKKISATQSRAKVRPPHRSPPQAAAAPQKMRAAASFRATPARARSHQAAHDTRQTRRPSGRHHAPAPGFFITHVEGASFPVVNGKTLDAQAHSLNDHDVIELAGSR